MSANSTLKWQILLALQLWRYACYCVLLLKSQRSPTSVVLKWLFVALTLRSDPAAQAESLQRQHPKFIAIRKCAAGEQRKHCQASFLCCLGLDCPIAGESFTARCTRLPPCPARRVSSNPCRLHRGAHLGVAVVGRQDPAYTMHSTILSAHPCRSSSRPGTGTYFQTCSMLHRIRGHGLRWSAHRPTLPGRQRQRLAQITLAFRISADPACFFAGTSQSSQRSRGHLQVRSAAAESVKVYQKEHKLGKSHKLKVTP